MQLSLTKTNILKLQNWIKEDMKIDFSLVIFTYKFQVTFDGLDGWAKRMNFIEFKSAFA